MAKYVLLLLLLCMACTEKVKKIVRQTNVLFILVDDLGWKDLGCYGSSFYETPNIDRLANMGYRFTQAA